MQPRTVLVPGVAWPDPSAPPWIRPANYYPQDFAVKKRSQADELLEWMKRKGWVMPMDAALAYKRPPSVASRLMQRLEEAGKLESQWMRARRSNRVCKYYRVKLEAA